MLLYEIKENIKNLIDNMEIDEETGEVLNLDALDELNEQFNDKAENVALYIKNITAEAAMVKAEEKKLAERRKTLENKSECLKAYLSGAMPEVGVDKISTPRAVMVFRKSTVIDIDDNFVEWAQKNADFLLDYKMPAANKAAIKNAINCGSQFEFARLKENKNLVIR